MPQEIRVWAIESGGKLRELRASAVQKEESLEDWLEGDISVLSDDLLVIGRQVETGFGKIDLLCLHRTGDVVIVELKRDKTARTVAAQTIDYASWVERLSNEELTEIANAYLKEIGPLEKAYEQRFGEKTPESLNENHSMLVVGAEIDEGSARIIGYLSEKHGVPINAATFRYLRDGADGREYLARVFLTEPSQVEYRFVTRSGGKRAPNLTYEELLNIAEENRVGDLYTTLFDSLNRLFDSTRTTRSSLSFIGEMTGRQRAILNLVPRESSESLGLKYQIYIKRFSDFLKMDHEEALKILPHKREKWEYPSSEGGPEWQGFEGYFSSVDEVSRFMEGLKRTVRGSINLTPLDITKVQD